MEIKIGKIKLKKLLKIQIKNIFEIDDSERKIIDDLFEQVLAKTEFCFPNLK